VTRLGAKLFFTLAVVLSAIVYIVPVESQNIDQKQIDGPVFVDLGELFNRAPIKIEDLDLAKLPALPRGYVALNNKAYLITTEAVAAGPYTVRFRAGSIADEETFKNLRIFHTEPDEFDPASLVWVDRTSGHPNTPDPDFRNKIIHAFSDELYPGIYVIGKMVEKIPPSKAVTDLEVVAKGTPEQVQLPENVAFQITVKNKGPDAATNVGAIMNQSSVGGYFVSATPSQGTCKYLPSGVYCKLGQLAAGGSATIKLVLAPEQDFGERPYESEIRVSASEQDSKLDNNQTTGSVFVRSDPNEPPEISLDRTPTEELVEQGTTVVFKATATDPDGSIAKVEFYDLKSGELLGNGISADTKNFSFSTNALSNGRHVVAAVATDNGGRWKQSGPLSVFVNGPIKVRIVEPKAGSLLRPGSEITVVAEATHPSGQIKQLEFSVAHGISIGKATPELDNRFTLGWRDAGRAQYEMEAVATDEAGLISKSSPVAFAVAIPPTVKIVAPVEGATLVTPVTIEIVLNYKTINWLSRVEIFANDERIEKDAASGPEGKYSCTWKNVKPGKYVLKAVVFDDIGVRAESTSVNIVVKNRGKD
jgi:uncharacterized repeat protein (TIGR01451 family)